jgi:hypothetical protein
VRILLRPRLPVLALLLLAPGIPELLTGSTPITPLVTNPTGFAGSFLLDVGLYGTGALLIREFAVAYRKGWASILFLGAAYGIAEEGFAVHTFFQTTGSPVNALGSYGHAFGVNWVWALGLTIFHATYSMALPILLTQLWFPTAKDVRWLDRGSTGVVAVVYVCEVGLFAHLVGHGPSPAALAFFLGIVAVLLYLALRVPRDFLSVPSGQPRIGRWGLALAGTLEFDAWVGVLVLSNTAVPAIGAVAVVLAANAGALFVILRRVGTGDLDRSKFYFAAGMLAVLFVWDIFVEFTVPGILVVSVLFLYLLYRLNRTLARRLSPSVPAAVQETALP